MSRDEGAGTISRLRHWKAPFWRLATEGTTFKDIKNQVRRDTALHFLGKQGLSIEEIAYRS